MTIVCVVIIFTKIRKNLQKFVKVKNYVFVIMKLLITVNDWNVLLKKNFFKEFNRTCLLVDLRL